MNSRLPIEANKRPSIGFWSTNFENSFEKVLEFIERARDVGLGVEITAVAIPEVKVSEIEKVASDMGVGVRVRPYRPYVW